jgi:hypothetical protein
MTGVTLRRRILERNARCRWRASRGGARSARQVREQGGLAGLPVPPVSSSCPSGPGLLDRAQARLLGGGREGRVA